MTECEIGEIVEVCLRLFKYAGNLEAKYVRVDVDREQFNRLDPLQVDESIRKN